MPAQYKYSSIFIIKSINIHYITLYSYITDISLKIYELYIDE